MKISEVGEGLGAVNHDSERIRMEFVEDQQEETESKRQKWEKAHQAKLDAGKGSNMDINVRIKRMQLNITGDNEFYQK